MAALGSGDWACAERGRSTARVHASEQALSYNATLRIAWSDAG